MVLAIGARLAWFFAQEHLGLFDVLAISLCETDFAEIGLHDSSMWRQTTRVAGLAKPQPVSQWTTEPQQQATCRRRNENSRTIEIQSFK